MSKSVTIPGMTGHVRRNTQVSALMEEVAQGSEQQNAAVGQVSIAVNQMDEVTQQNAALVEQTANASSSLEQQARELLSAVEFFEVGQQAPTSQVERRPAQEANLTATASRRMLELDPRPGRSKLGQTARTREKMADWESF